jgi:hypothetical protein
MPPEEKTEEIREYYLGKLKEAEENALTAAHQDEQIKWRKIALGYEMLAGVSGSSREADQGGRGITAEQIR